MTATGSGAALVKKPLFKQLSTMSYKGSEILVASGSVHVQSEAVLNIVRKSGNGGFFFRPVGRDDDIEGVPLRSCPTLEEAKALAKKLGNINLGISYTKASFVARVKASDKPEAFAMLYPEFAELIGKELLDLPRGEGFKCTIHGVPLGMDDHSLVASLVMVDRDGERWRFQPLSRKPTTKGCGDVAVRALAPPPQSSAVLVSENGFLRQRILISQPPPKRSVWDKVVDTEPDSSVGGTRADFSRAGSSVGGIRADVSTQFPMLPRPEPRGWFNRVDLAQHDGESDKEFHDAGDAGEANPMVDVPCSGVDVIASAALNAQPAAAAAAPTPLPQAKAKAAPQTSLQEPIQPAEPPEWARRLSEITRAADADRHRAEETRAAADRRITELQASLDAQAKSFTDALEAMGKANSEAQTHMQLQLQQLQTLQSEGAVQQQQQMTQLRQSQEAFQLNMSHQMNELFSRLAQTPLQPQLNVQQTTQPTLPPMPSAADQQARAVAGAAAGSGSIAPARSRTASISSLSAGAQALLRTILLDRGTEIKSGLVLSSGSGGTSHP